MFVCLWILMGYTLRLWNVIVKNFVSPLYKLICRQREFKFLKSELVLLVAQYFPLRTRFDLSRESGKPANFGRRRKVAAATWFDKGLNKGELVPGKPGGESIHVSVLSLSCRHFDQLSSIDLHHIVYLQRPYRPVFTKTLRISGTNLIFTLSSSEPITDLS